MIITEANADRPNSITIIENSWVDGKDIYLGDIASIDASNEMEGKTIGKVYLCQAAKPGSKLTLNISYIKSIAKQQGISTESLIWNSPDNIVIQTRSKVASSDEIQIAAEKFVKQMVGDLSATVNIYPTNEIRAIVLPNGDVNIKVASLSRHPINGNYSLRFTFFVDGRECEKRLIPFKAEVISEVVVASKQIEMGKVLAEDDLITASKDIGLSSNVFCEKDKLIGKRAKRMISQDSFITSDMVEQPPIIKLGDLITIVVESASLKITAQGKAMENGIKGQVIRVINASSLRELQAQVVDANTVRVSL